MFDEFFCIGCGRQINKWRAAFCHHCGAWIPDHRQPTKSDLKEEREEYADVDGKCSQQHHDYLASLVIFCRYCGLRLRNEKAEDCDHECHEQFESEIVLNAKIAEHILPCCIYCEACRKTLIYDKWIRHLEHCPVLTRVNQRVKIILEDRCRCKLHDSEMSSCEPHSHLEPCCYECRFCKGMVDKSLRLFHQGCCVMNPTHNTR